MSTGCNCLYLEIKKGEWYYVLEESDAPKNAWDWREYATACGPFATFDLAYEHLHAHHANPGGFSIGDLPVGVTERDLSKDEVLRNLITNATSPRKETSWRRW